MNGTIPSYEDPVCPVPFTPGGDPGSPVPDVIKIKASQATLTREYVASGATYHATSVPLALPTTIDDVMRERGSRHYEWMMTDPVVSASVQALKLAILAGGMDLKASVSAKPGTKELGGDEKLAQDLVDFCWRCVERCRGWNAFLIGMLGAAAFGNKMAEKTFEVAATGPDSGKLVWKTIKVKPRDAWQFVVDDAMNVLGILFRKSDRTQAFLPREKVVLLSWDAQDADPRGTSVLRPSVEPCNLKRLIWPQLYKHICQFGSASLVGKTAEGEVDRQPVDEDGAIIAGAALVSPQQFMASQMVNFQNGSVLVVPAGAEIIPIQPQGEGEVFHAAVDLFNREIVQAILLQTRATREAEHGSKADSETGQDIFGLLVASGRETLAQALRDDCFRQLVALNYGQETADEFTPLVTFGTETQDRPAQWSAVGNLMGSGYLGQSQMEELDSMMGLPIRDAQADAAKAQEQAEAAAKLARPMDGAAVDPKVKTQKGDKGDA